MHPAALSLHADLAVLWHVLVLQRESFCRN